MKIFSMDIDTFELSIEPEVLKIKEFAALINRDKTKNKIIGQAELAYIWFFCDFKSDFLQIIDEDERSIEIIKTIEGLPKNWAPDEAVNAAKERYLSLSRSVASRMLEDARTIINNMSTHAKHASLNFDELDDNGKPRYDMAKVQAFIRDVPKMIDTLMSLEEKVLREKDMSHGHRGSQEKALFEDEEE